MAPTTKYLLALIKKQDISLYEVARKAKISSDALEAIEEGKEVSDTVLTDILTRAFYMRNTDAKKLIDQWKRS